MKGRPIPLRSTLPKAPSMTSQHAPSSPQAGTPWTLFRDLELLGVWGTCLVLFITDSCSDDVCSFLFPPHFAYFPVT